MVSTLRRAVAHRSDPVPYGRASADLTLRYLRSVGVPTEGRHAPPPPLAGWHQQGQREQIGRDGHQGPGGVRGLTQRAVVADRAVGRGILDQRTDHVGLLEIEGPPAGVGDHDVDAAR